MGSAVTSHASGRRHLGRWPTLTTIDPGSGYAAGITKKKVKQIAAKVVKREAPGLSVRNATRADDATRLNGQTASNYLNQYYTVNVNQATAVSSFTKQIPTVPNGTYLATLNISADQMADDTPFFCAISTSAEPSAPKLMTAFGANFASDSLINAARVITVSGPMHLYCETGSGTFDTIGGSYPPYVLTFTRVDAGPSLGAAT